jgi:hypothetical protein
MKLFDNITKGASFSPCRRYRYTLWRIWDFNLPNCVFIGLNPSTADAVNDDRTVSRCISFAHGWGYGSLWMLNLFAWRATDPEDMKAAASPVGQFNDRELHFHAHKAGIVIAAWGQHGEWLGRAADVLGLLGDRKLHCLGLTKEGHPRHPLYLSGKLKPILFREASNVVRPNFNS